eukprot:scaffold30435_cov129-Isochrysis_galbana.AAC.2
MAIRIISRSPRPLWRASLVEVPKILRKGAVSVRPWCALHGGGREPLLAAGGRLNLVRVRVGQLLSRVGVAGQNSGTARRLGGPGQSQSGAGPGVEKPSWSWRRSRTWRDDERADQSGKVYRASGARLRCCCARAEWLTHRVIPAFGASMAPQGVCRSNATGRRASCPPYRGSRAPEGRAESGLRLGVGVCAAYVSHPPVFCATLRLA